MMISSPSGSGVEYLRKFSAAFNTLRTNLRKNYGMGDWVGVIEFTEKGAPHLHMIFEGDYIVQEELSRAAVGKLGRLGKYAYIKPFDLNQNLPGYMTKEVGQLAGYLAKSQVDPRVVATKFHPLRKSRAWYPGGQGEAERVVRARWLNEKGLKPIQADDWEMVKVDANGNLSPVNRSKPAEVLALPVVHANSPNLSQAA